MDLPVYVEYGAADIGIIGKDVLKEEERDVYELLDMGYGKCHLMMAVPEEKVLPRMMDYTHMRVATKYPHSAVEFFDRQGMQMEIIKLNGSIELAPIVGLSELIVDIVETGTTIRENHLKEVATVYESSARLIANKVSFKLQHERIKKLVEDLKAVLKEGRSMKIFDERKSSAEEISRLLKKKAFDEVELSPRGGWDGKRCLVKS